MILGYYGTAQRAGDISPAHAKVITRLRHVLPDVVDKEHGDAIEATLVEHAANLDPRQLAVAARRARELLDPDGATTRFWMRDCGSCAPARSPTAPGHR